jgi:hypothetical protein
LDFKGIQSMVKGKLKLKGNEMSEMSFIKSAINQAYVNFAMRDCIIGEYEYLIASKSLELPSDFLVFHSLYVTVINDDLTESTYKIPRHYLEIKTSTMFIRDDVFLSDLNIKSIKLIYGCNPDELVADTDIPLISVNYHQGLVYYALFLMSDDKKYYDLYMNVYNSIPRDDYVANYTDIVDVL